MLVIDNIERPLAVGCPLHRDHRADVHRSAARSVKNRDGRDQHACSRRPATICSSPATSARARSSAGSIPEVERPEQREFERQPARVGAGASRRTRGSGADHHPRLPRGRRAEADGRRTSPGSRMAAALPVSADLARAAPIRARPAKHRAADPVRESLRGLLAAWHEHFGDRPTPSRKHQGRREREEQGGDKISFTRALQEAMEAVAGEKGGVNARRLGRFSASMSVGSKADCGSPGRYDRASAALWQVERRGLGFDGFFPGPSREKGNGKRKDEGIFR